MEKYVVYFEESCAFHFAKIFYVENQGNGLSKTLVLLSHYAALIGNRLPTFRYNLTVPFSRVKFEP
jgi:hypothetical protein